MNIKKYKDKKISILGDSISTFDSETVYDTIDGFHPDGCGMKSIANAVLDCLKSGNL